MKYQLDIYEHNSRNFKKGGSLSKRAIKARGSKIEVSPDNVDREKIDLRTYLEKFEYKNIHTGYIDNILYLECDGRKYVAFQSIQRSGWPYAIAIGFSNDIK